MSLTYLHLTPETALPNLDGRPFRAIIISEIVVADEWRTEVAKWLIANNGLYVVAWGLECERWHDAVDWAVLEAFDYKEIPNDRFVMTTWHADEPLSEAFWFAGNLAFHPDVELATTVIVHIAEQARQAELLQSYNEAQATPDDGVQ